jgi:hypothetical protein
LGSWGVCPRNPTRFFKPTNTATETLATGFMKSLLQRRENNIERKQKRAAIIRCLNFCAPQYVLTASRSQLHSSWVDTGVAFPWVWPARSWERSSMDLHVGPPLWISGAVWIGVDVAVHPDEEIWNKPQDCMTDRLPIQIPNLMWNRLLQKNRSSHCTEDPHSETKISQEKKNVFCYLMRSGLIWAGAKRDAPEMREPGFPMPSDFAAASTHDNQTREKLFSERQWIPKENVLVLQKWVVDCGFPWSSSILLPPAILPTKLPTTDDATGFPKRRSNQIEETPEQAAWASNWARKPHEQQICSLSFELRRRRDYTLDRGPGPTLEWGSRAHFQVRVHNNKYLHDHTSLMTKTHAYHRIITKSMRMAQRCVQTISRRDLEEWLRMHDSWKQRSSKSPIWSHNPLRIVGTILE